MNTSGNETTATVTFQPVSSASVTMYEQPTVYVNLVYTAAVTEETEVWWCDNWKML